MRSVSSLLQCGRGSGSYREWPLFRLRGQRYGRFHFVREHPKRVVVAVCAAILLVFLGQVAGWDYRNFPCMFRLSRVCAVSLLNRSPALRNERLKVQAVGTIKYVGPSEALV